MSKMLRIIAVIVLASLLIMGAVGCGTSALTSIKSTPDTVSLAPEATQQLAITASYTKGASEIVTNESAYRSSNGSIATVTTGGLITGVAAGSASITVSYTVNKVTKTVTVPVTVKLVRTSLKR